MHANSRELRTVLLGFDGELLRAAWWCSQRRRGDSPGGSRGTLLRSSWVSCECRCRAEHYTPISRSSHRFLLEPRRYRRRHNTQPSAVTCRPIRAAQVTDSATDLHGTMVSSADTLNWRIREGFGQHRRVLDPDRRQCRADLRHRTPSTASVARSAALARRSPLGGTGADPPLLASILASRRISDGCHSQVSRRRPQAPTDDQQLIQAYLRMVDEDDSCGGRIHLDRGRDVDHPSILSHTWTGRRAINPWPSRAGSKRRHDQRSHIQIKNWFTDGEHVRRADTSSLFEGSGVDVDGQLFWSFMARWPIRRNPRIPQPALHRGGARDADLMRAA